MKRYLVSGMVCAACRARVEKAVSRVPGVTSCAVDLLLGTLNVEGNCGPDAVISAVKQAGYGIVPAEETVFTPEREEALLADRETPLMKKRLALSCVFLLPLMYLAMGQGILPAVPVLPPTSAGAVQMILCCTLIFINRRFFVSGFAGLLHRAPNMDTLISLGSASGFVYSAAALFSGRAEEGLYFDSAGMILVLITVGKMLESRAKGRATDALKSLMRLAPATAVVIRDGAECEVPVSEVAEGDVFIVRPGDAVPVDGVVIEGASSVNEAALTGESIPVDKSCGDPVRAPAVNQAGFLRCRASRVGQDTMFAQIIRLVEETAAGKAPIARIADRISGVFVPVVIGISLVTVLVWLLCGAAAGHALARGIAVLVVSCPCALGLATPVAIMAGSALGARCGILFKTAAALEETGRVRTVVLDKTGTVTCGEPEVTGVFPAEGVSEEELLRLACALEMKSEHPLARAVVRHALKRFPAPESVSDFQALPGCGVTGTLNGETLLGGSMAYVGARCGLPPEASACALAGEGATPLAFLRNGGFLGIVAVADRERPESADAVRQLKEMGLRVILLTGDNARTAESVGRRTGIDETAAEVLPGEKAAFVDRLRRSGKTAMAGDGINDAPALTAADVGIAVGNGTDAALAASDVVLMKNRVTDIPAAIRLGRATLATIRENLFWAFFYNVLGIPLAAGCFENLFGWSLSPMIAAAAMSLSSLFVVTNALRLSFYDPCAAGRDKAGKDSAGSEPEQKEEKVRTLFVEGMMCGHCENSVRESLLSLPGVGSAQVSSKAGTAVVTMKEEIGDDALRSAVESKGYKVRKIV